jgi:hypothetical protein
LNISPYFGNPEKVKEITDMIIEIFISDPNHDNPDFSFTNPQVDMYFYTCFLDKPYKQVSTKYSQWVKA